MPHIARRITSFSQQEIRRLFYSASKIYQHPGLDIRVAKTNNPIGRILIITPKKLGSAPMRNLVRRRIKSIFYQECLFKLNYDWIVFCKKEIINLSFTELKDILISVASKI